MAEVVKGKVRPAHGSRVHGSRPTVPKAPPRRYAPAKMPQPPKLAMGRIVRYVSMEAGVCAAMVTRVHEGDLIDLQVAIGNRFEFRDRVPFLATAITEGTWHWPDGAR